LEEEGMPKALRCVRIALAASIAVLRVQPQIANPTPLTGVDSNSKVFDLKPVWSFDQFEETVRPVAMSRDGRSIAAGSEDGMLRMWYDRRLIWETKVPFFELRLAFSVDGRILAVANGNSQPLIQYPLTLRETQTGKPIATLGDGEGTKSLEFSPSGRLLSTTNSRTATLTLWDLSTRLPSSPLAHMGVAPANPHLHLTGKSDIRTSAFSADGRLIAAGGGGSGMVSIWDTTTRQLIRSISAGCDVFSLSFAPDAKSLAAGCRDGNGPGFCGGMRSDVCPTESAKVVLFDVANGRDLRTLNGHKRDVESVAFSPDGQWLATASTQILVWEAATGKLVWSGNPCHDWTFDLSWSQNGDYMVTGCLKSVVLMRRTGG
jgi:WD40 repeat protein